MKIERFNIYYEAAIFKARKIQNIANECFYKIATLKYHLHYNPLIQSQFNL